MTSSELSAVVVGGGIGGLAAAIALRDVGAAPVVLERAADPRRAQMGAGIAVWPNGMRALQELGVADRVEAAGATIDAVEMCASDGSVLNVWSMDRVSRALGAPTVCVDRGELHRALATRLGDGPVRLGARCIEVRQEDGAATVDIESGETFRASLVVGADGLRSRIRTQLFPDVGSRYPPYAGYALWHAIIERDDPAPRRFRLYFGRGVRFAYYSIGGGRVYWSGIAYQPPGVDDQPGGRKRMLLERYGRWESIVPDLIEATDESAISRVDVFGGEPLPRWVEGRVTLLGDAAHAMTTVLGQGACMALEDGVALAGALRSSPDVVAALRAFETVRRARTSRVMAFARRFSGNAAAEHPVRAWVRDRVIAHLGKRMLQRPYEEELVHGNGRPSTAAGGSLAPHETHGGRR